MNKLGAFFFCARLRACFSHRYFTVFAMTRGEKYFFARLSWPTFADLKYLSTCTAKSVQP
jgi:hypothetical protein